MRCRQVVLPFVVFLALHETALGTARGSQPGAAEKPRAAATFAAVTRFRAIKGQTPGRVRTLAARAVARTLKALYPEQRLRIALLRLRTEEKLTDLALAPGATLHVDMAVLSGPDSRGRIILEGRVTVRERGRGHDRGRIRAEVLVRASAAVHVPMRQQTRGGGGSADAAVGKSTKQEAQGKQTRKPAVRVVRMGQQVKVVLASPGLRLETAGIALDTGVAGTRIRVKNTGSGRVFSGRVGADGAVHVQEVTAR